MIQNDLLSFTKRDQRRHVLYTLCTIDFLDWFACLFLDSQIFDYQLGTRGESPPTAVDPRQLEDIVEVDSLVGIHSLFNGYLMEQGKHIIIDFLPMEISVFLKPFSYLFRSNQTYS